MGGGEVVDETALCQGAKPLFYGHSQPNVYTFDGTADSTVWDDADPRVMQSQIDLAQNYGIDGFIFDTYVGVKGGVLTAKKRLVSWKTDS